MFSSFQLKTMLRIRFQPILLTLLLSSSINLFADFEDDKCVIIASENAGSKKSPGFLAKYKNSIYVFTSQQALFGIKTISLNTLSGKKLNPLSIEISPDRDIARITVEEKALKYFEFEENQSMGESAVVLAVNPGSSGLENISSSISGIGPKLFEISNNIPVACIGSPILNGKDKVIGIATSTPFRIETGMTWAEDHIIIIRNNKLGVKLSSNIKWLNPEWEKFHAQTTPMAEAQNPDFLDKLVAVINIWGKNPYRTIDNNAIQVPDVMKSWLQKHNTKAKKYPKFSADIEKDPVHFQALAKRLCDSKSSEALRLSHFPLAKANALKSQDLTPYLKKHAEEVAESYNYLSDIIIMRGQTVRSIWPTIF